MIMMDNELLAEITEYLCDQPDDDTDACILLAQIETYIDNQAKVDAYQAEALAAIRHSLIN